MEQALLWSCSSTKSGLILTSKLGRFFFLLVIDAEAAEAAEVRLMNNLSNCIQWKDIPKKENSVVSETFCGQWMSLICY